MNFKWVFLNFNIDYFIIDTITSLFVNAIKAIVVVLVIFYYYIYHRSNRFEAFTCVRIEAEMDPANGFIYFFIVFYVWTKTRNEIEADVFVRA